MHVFIVEFWLKIPAIQEKEQAPVTHSQEWTEADFLGNEAPTTGSTASAEQRCSSTTQFVH